MALIGYSYSQLGNKELIWLNRFYYSRYKSDADDNSLWLHPNVFPMWNVQAHPEVDASPWLLSTYDACGMHQVYEVSVC